MPMPYPNITSLFKYRSVTDFSLDALERGQIWVSKPGAFNDPFDCSLDYNKVVSVDTINAFLNNLSADPNVSAEEIKEVRDSLLDVDGKVKKGVAENKMLVDAFDTFQREVTEYGVLSLTENCENILMWSHYADNHKGFCLEFERGEDNDLGDYRKTKQVTYSRHCPIIDVNKVVSNDNPKGEFLKMLFTKSEEWRYEQEWRICYSKGNSLMDYPGPLKAIIFGHLTSENHKQAIKERLSSSPAVVYKQTERVSGEFRVSIV